MEAKDTHCLISLNPRSFPGKLWHLVNDPHIFSVCWDASGEKILIHQQPFEAEVLFSHRRHMNKYFKTSDFSSFVRQLNLYGFRKVRLDQDVPESQLDESFIVSQPHHFQNPNFRRDKPELLAKLKRLTAINKAKLAAGEELTCRASKCYHHVRLPSLQENCAAMKNGSVSFPHHGTPYHHHCYGPQLVQDCDRIPKSSQAFVVGHGEPSHHPSFTNRVEPFSMFYHFPMNSPCAQVCSSVHMKKDVMSHNTQYRFYTPVCQCCRPGFLDSEEPVSQQPDESCSPCGYYSEYSVSCGHPVEQSPDWKAGDASTSRKSDVIVNLDTVFKVADEMQAAANSQRSCRGDWSPGKTA